MNILILGGTGDALALTRTLSTLTDFPPWIVTLSLAGRTRSHSSGNWRTRVGGFGGVEGLINYLNAELIDLLIDATHPFAAQISHQAWAAANALAIPYLCLTRSPWEAEPGDYWIEVANYQAAADILSDLGQRIFLSIGRQELANYAHLNQLWFLMRAVEPPNSQELLPPGLMKLAKGPFSAVSERALLEEHAIEVIVSKNSGGLATYGKLKAARELQLPVVMIQRPSPPPGHSVETVEEVVSWISMWAKG
jgi:precorrin-6A/cobalt-precorrin-6A reductase